MTNQTPPDEGIVNSENSCIELKRLDKNLIHLRKLISFNL